jgi:hypothetical protein
MGNEVLQDVENCGSIATSRGRSSIRVDQHRG